MTESILTFGPSQGLVGILSLPAGNRAPIAVLLSNTGMNTRVGPFRLNVELARAFAKAGIPTLRYDRSGLGDSARRESLESDHEHAVLDSQDAMDALQQQFGIEQFVILALCSGVDVAHRVSLEDTRIIGTVFIDGYAYSTPGFRWRRTLPRLFNAARLRRYLRRRVHRSQHPEFFAEPSADSARVFTRDIPTLAQFRADVRAMAARGARVLMVYTGAMGVHVNAPEQLYEMVGQDVSRELVAVAWMPAADHLFSQHSARRELQASLLRWLRLLPALAGTPADAPSTAELTSEKPTAATAPTATTEPS